MQLPPWQRNGGQTQPAFMQCKRTTRDTESVVVEPTIARTIVSNVSLANAFGKTSRPSSTTRMSLARNSRSPSINSLRAALSPRDHSEHGVQDTKAELEEP